MSECSGVSVGYHVGTAFLFVGFGLFVAGFSCPYWTGYEAFNIGLWLVCSPRDCRSLSTISPLFGGWWSAVQFFQCMSLMCFVVTTGHSILVTWVAACRGTGPNLNRPGRPRKLLLAGTALAGGFGLVGDAIFAAKVTTGNFLYSVISWAFAINVVGCFFAVIALIIIAVSSCHQRRNLTTAYSHSNRQQVEVPRVRIMSRREATRPPFVIALPGDSPETIASRTQILLTRL